MTSGINYSNHPVDQMYAAQKRIAKGTHAIQDLSNDCCHKEGKIGAVAGGAILGVAFTAIPPPGAFTVFGIAIGAVLGGVIGESCRNDKIHRD
jgi:outer membrane lipoprotein SlyB